MPQSSVMSSLFGSANNAVLSAVCEHEDEYGVQCRKQRIVKLYVGLSQSLTCFYAIFITVLKQYLHLLDPG
jgi:hypothetical protein